jgi:hypothetical protein
MKRLFRRQPQSVNDSQGQHHPTEPQSEADMDYFAFEPDMKSTTILMDSSKQSKASLGAGLHQRAWSLESDLRISRGEPGRGKVT